jgi:protocatechuate 3,4-dioxygenase alpha subunit
VSIFARGLLKRAVTRMYFSDESLANDADPVLRSIGDVAARRTLVATQRDGGYVFDIRLQGEGETVFFDG